MEPLNAEQAGKLDRDLTSDARTPSAAEPTLDRDAVVLDHAVRPTRLPEPGAWADPLTGTEGPQYWDRILASEGARRRRSARTATVALVEFTGFENSKTWLDRDLAVRVFARLARVVAAQVRSSDHLARVGRTRFGIILVETDEVRAINFVDRLRQACGNELGSFGDFGVRIGWASPADAASLESAVASAEARLGDGRYQSH